MIGLNLGLWQGRRNRATVIASALAAINARSPAILYYGSNATVDGANAETGDQVSSWTDLSGNTRHATQSTQTRQPTIAQNSNGDNVLRFSRASTDCLVAPGSWLTGLTSCTMVVVFKFTGDPAGTTTSGQCLWSWDSGDFRYSVDANSMQCFVGGSNGSFTFTDTTNYHISVVDYDGGAGTDATKLIVDMDGVAQSLSFSAGIPTSIPTITAGRIAARSDDTRSLEGDIALLAGFPAKLSPADRAAVLDAVKVLHGAV
jgi:hypothetical protein